MENAIAVGLSKQIVLARALSVTANNIANQTTAGFKADRVAFQEYISTVSADPNSPTFGGDRQISLVVDPDSYTDFSAGAVDPTYADLDFAIDGDGFFAVETPDGIRYTRDGHFGLNEFGELVTRDGAAVLDASSSPILVDPELGALVLSPDGELQQGGASVATMGVFQFNDNRALSKDGDNLFAARGEEPTAVSAPKVRQGFIETSNVAPIAMITQMIEINRSYEQTAQLIKTANDLARDAVRRLSQEA